MSDIKGNWRRKWVNCDQFHFMLLRNSQNQKKNVMKILFFCKNVCMLHVTLQTLSAESIYLRTNFKNCFYTIIISHHKNQ